MLTQQKEKVYGKRKLQVNLPLQSLQTESNPIVSEKSARLPLGLTGVSFSGSFSGSLKAILSLNFPSGL